MNKKLIQIILKKTVYCLIGFLACILILFIFAISVVLFINGSYTVEKARKFRVESDMRLIEKVMQRYLDDGGSWDNIPTDTPPERINFIVVSTLTKPIALGPYLAIDDDENGVLADPWGEPYLMLVASEPNKGITIGDRNVKRPFIIWSSGPNRINEFGKGDDIK